MIDLLNKKQKTKSNANNFFILHNPVDSVPHHLTSPYKITKIFYFGTTPIYNLRLHFNHHPKSPTLTINRVPLVDRAPLKSTKALILNTPICNLTLQLNSQTTVTAAPILSTHFPCVSVKPSTSTPSFQSPTLLKII